MPQCQRGLAFMIRIISWNNGHDSALQNAAFCKCSIGDIISDMQDSASNYRYIHSHENSVMGASMRPYQKIASAS
jgi:hypothetical protein